MEPLTQEDICNMSKKIPLFCFAFGALSVSQVLNVSKNRKMFIGYCLLLTLIILKTSQNEHLRRKP